MTTDRIDVLSILTRLDGDMCLPDLGEISAARAAIAEVIACSSVTVRAFEALGTTRGVMANIEAHRECERALIEQKAALARVGAA